MIKKCEMDKQACRKKNVIVFVIIIKINCMMIIVIIEN